MTTAAGDVQRGTRPALTVRLRQLVSPILGLALFFLALFVLRHELRAYEYADVMAALRAVPAWRVAAALVLTVASYLALTGYDALGLRYLGHSLSYGRIALAAFVGYAFGHSLVLVTGGAVRYRLYAGWGLSAVDIAKVLALNGLTFWLGAVGLAGASLVVGVSLLAPDSEAPNRAVGVACLALVTLYVALCAVRRAPMRVGSWSIALPPARLALVQLVLSVVDWMLAASVLYVLLPPVAGLTFVGFIGAFVLAQTVGLASSVPGGIGVFETAMVLVLGPFIPGATVLGTVLAYRVIYYLLPLMTAALLLGAHEVKQQRTTVAVLGRLLRPWTGVVAPQMFALTTALGAATLLLSGATPAVQERLDQLAGVLPLALVEMAHVAASVVGVWLLVVARGLQRRLGVAYLLAVALLFAGALLSLANGLEYGEAFLLVLMGAALVPSRHEFYRRGGLFDAPFTAGWAATAALTLAATSWMLVLSHDRATWAATRWWRFAFEDEAARALRATTAALVFAGVFGLMLLRRSVPRPPVMAPAEERTRVETIVAASPRAPAQLALLGDKQFLIGERRDAFLMYATRKRSWVAMGDPIGPIDETRELVWRFRELVDRHGGRTIFYDVGDDLLPVYADIGLSLMKLGEEARVALADFDLASRGCEALRRAHGSVAAAGYAFGMLDPERLAATMDELAEVSREWRVARHAEEKGFALGRFDATYVGRLPVAVVRHQHRVVAFAVLWRGADRRELAVDLVRYRADAPDGVMDYLLVEVMLWARAGGIHDCSLGMAPLAGLEDRALRPMQTRLGAFLFRLGEHFDDFRRLRAYKEAFGPTWQPRYLATQGGLGVPRALLDVAALITGERPRRSWTRGRVDA